jgi:hypothetical protein
MKKSKKVMHRPYIAPKELRNPVSAVGNFAGKWA